MSESPTYQGPVPKFELHEGTPIFSLPDVSEYGKIEAALEEHRARNAEKMKELIDAANIIMQFTDQCAKFEGAKNPSVNKYFYDKVLPFVIEQKDKARQEIEAALNELVKPLNLQTNETE